MCTPSTSSIAEDGTISGFSPLTFWQSLARRGPRQGAETVAYLSTHLLRDIGLDDGRPSGRTAGDFTGRHGLAP